VIAAEREGPARSATLLGRADELRTGTGIGIPAFLQQDVTRAREAAIALPDAADVPQVEGPPPQEDPVSAFLYRLGRTSARHPSQEEAAERGATRPPDVLGPWHAGR